MKNRLNFALVLMLLMLSFALSPKAGKAQSAREIAQRVFPSVVLLVMEDAKGQPVSLGSGFFVQEDVVATNVHVVEGASRGYAKVVGQKRKLDIAGVFGIDELRDLVLLKLTSGKGSALTIGDDTKMAAGDTVYAVGNPEGLEGTFSQGIISGVRQVESNRLLQITAPISPGSSGGPILNGTGDVVGVAVSTYREGQNLNFAVPSSYLLPMLTGAKPLAELSTLASVKSTKSITSGSGEPYAEGVIAVNFKWTTGWGDYIFTLRNKLRDPVKNIIYVVIFYGKDGEPVHSELSQYRNPILGSLAKTLLTGYTGDAPHVGTQIQELTKRVEVRVLDFQVIRE
jgi:hypothetical protein